MAKSKRTSRLRFEGLILPCEGEKLRPLWKAFEKGSTWYRRGKRSAGRLKLGHTAYGGKVILEWWGDAIRYSVEDTDGSGKIGGAFLGHTQRHASGRVDRMDIRFSGQ